MSTNGPKLTSAISEAQSIVASAEKRAEEITAEATRVRDEAFESGYAAGYAEGLEAAAQDAVRLLEETSDVSDSLAREAARLALAIAGSVLGEEARVNPDVVQKIATKALQESIIGETALLLVHPEDLAGLESARGRLSRLAPSAVLSIESDDSISRGGCLIRTDFGEVDARVETLLTVVEARLGLLKDEDQV